MATATLRWSANTEGDVAGYKVYRAILPGAMVFLKDVGNVLIYVDSTLPANDTVDYNITCYDTSGNESPHSATVEKVFDTNPPLPPTGLSVVVTP